MNKDTIELQDLLFKHAARQGLIEGGSISMTEDQEDEMFEKELLAWHNKKVKEARIDELDRARANTRPSILYGTNIKYSAVADSYLIDRLSDLKTNRE